MVDNQEIEVCPARSDEVLRRAGKYMVSFVSCPIQGFLDIQGKDRVFFNDGDARFFRFFLRLTAVLGSTWAVFSLSYYIKLFISRLIRRRMVFCR